TPYRLQIFTYWTGLALTGRSAACAPATATSPAAEPRRRLFTIFILNLQKKFLSRGFRIRPVRQHPLELPLAPRWPEKPFTPLGASCSPDSATGGCPPPSRCHINGRTPLSNEEAPFPQVLTALFGRVLRKKHAVVIGLKRRFCLSQSNTNTALISVFYGNSVVQPGEEFWSPYLRQVEYRAGRSRDM